MTAGYDSSVLRRSLYSREKLSLTGPGLAHFSGQLFEIDWLLHLWVGFKGFLRYFFCLIFSTAPGTICLSTTKFESLEF